MVSTGIMGFTIGVSMALPMDIIQKRIARIESKNWIKIFFGPKNFMFYFIWCNCVEFCYGEYALGDLDQLYIHCVRFTETIVESSLQMMLSSYIIHHHGWNKPTFSNVQGDIQIFSLLGSTLSIILNMATRHEWFEHKKKPGFSEILKSLFTSACPVICYLLAKFIFLANSKMIILIYFGCSVSWMLFYYFCLRVKHTTYKKVSHAFFLFLGPLKS